MDAALEQLLEEIQRPVRATILKEIRGWTLGTFYESLSLDTVGFLGQTGLVAMFQATFEDRWVRSTRTRIGNVAVKRLTCIAEFKAWLDREVWDWEAKRRELGFKRAQALLLLRTGDFLDVILVKSRYNTINAASGPTCYKSTRKIADMFANDAKNEHLTVRTGLMAITGGHHRGFQDPGPYGFDWYAEGQAAFTILTGEGGFYRNFYNYILDTAMESRLAALKVERVAVLINQYLDEECASAPNCRPRYKHSTLSNAIVDDFTVDREGLITRTLANLGHGEDVKDMVKMGLIPAGTPPSLLLPVHFRRKPLHPEEALFDDLFK
jgi:hypothetical protein